MAVVAVGSGSTAGWRRPPQLTIRTGVPGRDHGGVLHDERAGGFGFAPAAAAARAWPSVAAVLGGIAAHLAPPSLQAEAPPC